jgi:hypothetical protein
VPKSVIFHQSVVRIALLLYASLVVKIEKSYHTVTGEAATVAFGALIVTLHAIVFWKFVKCRLMMSEDMVRLNRFRL